MYRRASMRTKWRLESPSLRAVSVMKRPCTGARSTEVTEAAPRDRSLKRDGSGAGKEVERPDSLDVDHVFDDVEDVFAREIGCRAGGD